MRANEQTNGRKIPCSFSGKRLDGRGWVVETDRGDGERWGFWRSLNFFFENARGDDIGIDHGLVEGKSVREKEKGWD